MNVYRVIIEARGEQGGYFQSFLVRTTDPRRAATLATDHVEDEILDVEVEASQVSPLNGSQGVLEVFGRSYYQE